MKMRKLFTFLICLIPLCQIKPFLLNMLGHKISAGVKIYFSFVWVDLLILRKGALIKSFNVIKSTRVFMGSGAWIGKLNYIGGDFDLLLKDDAKIINLNVISRGGGKWKSPRSKLILGRHSQITSLSTIDLAASVLIGEDTVLAGKGIQIWTHGFIHMKSRRRNLITGKIKIGDNVYIGARTCCNPGVFIGNNITIGINSIISKDIIEEGLYVSSPMRFVAFDPESQLKTFSAVNVDDFSYYERYRN